MASSMRSAVVCATALVVVLLGCICVPDASWAALESGAISNGEAAETGGAAESGSGSESESAVEESAVETAKRLISVLPADPDAITEADREAVNVATSAYDALDDDEKHMLDSTAVVGKEQTYGRWLESAQWGLAALQPVDNALDVVDGDYSAYVTSSSTMGKSNSERARSWSVARLSVADGKATGIVRCNSQSAFRNMRIGGVDYAADVVDGVPQFEVPVLVNGTASFTIDANAVADSIAYQLTVSLPLEPASKSDVSTAARLAAEAKAQAASKYAAQSADMVERAADVLAAVAGKGGVAAVEIAAATAALDAAIAEAEPIDAGGSGSGNAKPGSSGGADGDGKKPAKPSQPAKPEKPAKPSQPYDGGSGSSSDGDDVPREAGSDNSGDPGSGDSRGSGDRARPGGNAPVPSRAITASGSAAGGATRSQVSAQASVEPKSARMEKVADESGKAHKAPDARTDKSATMELGQAAADSASADSEGVGQAGGDANQQALETFILAGALVALLLSGMVARVFGLLRAKVVA